jgi:Secretion system C-terminal sorting domain
MKKIIAFIISSALCPNLFAQSIGPSTFNSAGGRATIGGNEYEYSIGEMAVVSTQTAGSITVTQGLLQPINNKADNVADYSLLEKQLSIFPNPTNSAINIALSSSEIKVTSIELLDVAGRLVLSIPEPNFTNQTFNINLAEYANGNYLLRLNAIANQTTFSSTSTIIKSN